MDSSIRKLSIRHELEMSIYNVWVGYLYFVDINSVHIRVTNYTNIHDKLYISGFLY
jgi:hypothetical protein